ncbi:FtsB family cell division protein [Sphingobacterium rhinopitheci]|uniref:FtsB family cell division protein n=1 Tax=Sphingobacterium rhinopitheci TaxID=2781960 RepID=UPI001F516849|nr:septum formation initiator family protein [Sphingobacterium rhinopitheci]MCI0922562.1 septum formation initiator family protein [Sphingobacterium rhinopitheci]
MERLMSVVKNKFLIAGLAFVLWMVFFDRYDLPTQYNFQNQKTKLEYEKEFYTTEITNIERAIKDVQYNQVEIQRIAREKYKMKKDNEDIYVIMEVEPQED